MTSFRILKLAGFLPPLLSLLLSVMPCAAQHPVNQPLPEIHELIREVHQHEIQLNKVRDNYTYTSVKITQSIDTDGRVKKTETVENDDFCVNGHLIERAVKKNYRPLDNEEQQKEAERVAKLVERAKTIPPDQPLEGYAINFSRVPEIISRILPVMDVRNARRVIWRGRPTIVFDLVGRTDAQTVGISEDASKNLQGTIWIDEADRVVAHLQARFNDNFHVALGLFASIQKGSSLRFDRALVNSEVWLPTGAEADLQGRILMVKSYHQHVTEHNYNFEHSRIEAQRLNAAEAWPQRK
jgi:hypothetical protein